MVHEEVASVVFLAILIYSCRGRGWLDYSADDGGRGGNLQTVVLLELPQRQHLAPAAARRSQSADAMRVLLVLLISFLLAVHHHNHDQSNVKSQ